MTQKLITREYFHWSRILTHHSLHCLFPLREFFVALRCVYLWGEAARLKSGPLTFGLRTSIYLKVLRYHATPPL